MSENIRDLYDKINRERGYPTSDCVLCGSNFVIEREYHAMGVCSECARKAGAAWLRETTGEMHPHLDPAGYAQKQVEKARKPTKRVIPQNLRWSVFERDQFRCVTCGTHLQLRCDHIIPESKGGPLTLDNLQTLCAPCNSRKGNRHE